MELSLIPVLTVFLLFAASGAAYFFARRTGIPHTVVLVALGVLLVALSTIEQFSFLRTFTLTPELLFFIFLPTLIFESAYNIHIRALTRDVVPVALLSIVSLLVSAGAIAVGLYYLLPLVGFPIPFTIAFLFGSLISATDPVAVLALFKEYGAPRRLTLLFEGESLFNDGTGFALFLIALEFVIKGGFEVATVLEGVVSFAIMIIGGALFGIILGGIFSKAIGYARSSESVSITLTLVLAHVTFLLSEFISHHAHIGSFDIHLSAIIATTMAAMVLGNYGRAKLPVGAHEFVEKFWGQIAFFANSIIFILVGMLAVSLPISSPQVFIPILVAVVVVAAGRALSIYGVLIPYNRIASAATQVPTAWQHLLAWGSLRGALAVTMALLIPVDLVVAGWANDLSVYQTILAFTTGCIFVTLFFKATTIGPLMNKLKVADLNALETAEYDESLSLVYARVLDRMETFAEKGYIDKNVYEHLQQYYQKRLRESCQACEQLRTDAAVADAALRVWLLGVERKTAEDLYAFGEISEHAYKRILGKLAVRREDADRGLSSSEVHLKNQGDAFEWMVSTLRRIIGAQNPLLRPEEKFMYYRALVITSNKVLKELARIDAQQHDGMFEPAVTARARAIYENFAQHARAKMEEVRAEHPEIIAPLASQLARCGVHKVEEQVLEDLIEYEMITPKVYAALRTNVASEQAV